MLTETRNGARLVFTQRGWGPKYTSSRGLILQSIRLVRPIVGHAETPSTYFPTTSDTPILRLLRERCIQTVGSRDLTWCKISPTWTRGNIKFNIKHDGPMHHDIDKRLAPAV